MLEKSMPEKARLGSGAMDRPSELPGDRETGWCHLIYNTNTTGTTRETRREKKNPQISFQICKEEFSILQLPQDIASQAEAARCVWNLQ